MFITLNGVTPIITLLLGPLPRQVTLVYSLVEGVWEFLGLRLPDL